GPRDPVGNDQQRCRRVLVQAKSCWAVVLVAAWDTSVPWLEMTVHVAIHPRNMVIAMLRFSSPLTAAATEIVIACLEMAADMAVDFDPPAAWCALYPLSAVCFTPVLARATLLDLVGKLRLPAAYVPTAYHWLLMYECLQVHIEVLNDMPLPSLVAQL